MSKPSDPRGDPTAAESAAAPAPVAPSPAPAATPATASAPADSTTTPSKKDQPPSSKSSSGNGTPNGRGHQRNHPRRGGGGGGRHHGNHNNNRRGPMHHGGHDRNRSMAHYGPAGGRGRGMGRGPPPPPPPGANGGGRGNHNNNMRNQGGGPPMMQFGRGPGGGNNNAHGAPMMRNDNMRMDMGGPPGRGGGRGRGVGRGRGRGRGHPGGRGDGRNDNMQGGFPPDGPRGPHGPMMDGMMNGQNGGGGGRSQFNQGPHGRDRRDDRGGFGQGPGGMGPPPQNNKQHFHPNQQRPLGGPPPPPPPMGQGQGTIPPPPPGARPNMPMNQPMGTPMQMPHNMQQGPGRGPPPPPPLNHHQQQPQQQMQGPPLSMQQQPHGQIIPPGQPQSPFPQQPVPQLQNMNATPQPQQQQQQQFSSPVMMQQHPRPGMQFPQQQHPQPQQQQYPGIQNPNMMPSTTNHQGIQGQQQAPVAAMSQSMNQPNTNPHGMIPNQQTPSNQLTQKPGPNIQQQTPTKAGNLTSTNQADNIAANWTVHKAPSGADYFYNSITKTSTYEKPQCLAATGAVSNTPAEASPSVNVSATTTTTTNQEKKTWKKYTDQASGRIYYSDGVTTTWDKPSDFESTSDPSTDTSLTSTKRNAASTAPEEGKKKKRKESKSRDTVSIYNSKAEAIAAFKGLLLAKDVSPTLKWNDVVKLCSSDARWDACNTMGERKQSLAEYQTKRANELREQKRKEKVRAKDAFMSLLTEVLPNVRAFDVSTNTRFNEVRDSLSKDDRFYAVDEEETREELFYDFVEELRKRDERQRRGRKMDCKAAFVAFLKYREEAGGLTFLSTWASFLNSLGDKDKVDSRFVVSPSMSDSDRQLYFADYVMKLQDTEDEKRRRIRDARRRAEKAQRDAYRESLRNLATQGKILPSSRWRNFEDLIAAESTFGPVSEQSKDAPRDIFEVFVEDWSDAYRRDKALLSHLMSSMKTFKATPETLLEDFTKALLEAAAYSADAYSDVRRIINHKEPISSAQLYFDEILLKSKKESQNSTSYARRGLANGDDSSSDEGEILEDEEAEEVKK